MNLLLAPSFPIFSKVNFYVVNFFARAEGEVRRLGV